MSIGVAGLQVHGWDVEVMTAARVATTYRLTGADGAQTQVVLERCALGRLRAAYPVSEHDIELRVVGSMSLSAELLAAIVDGVERADRACRRVVLATPEGDMKFLEVAEAAGFRYVVTVDVADGGQCLSVAEPTWVTTVDMDLDHVPQT